MSTGRNSMRLRRRTTRGSALGPDPSDPALGSNAAGVAEGRYGVQFVVGVEPHVVVANAVEGVLEPVTSQAKLVTSQDCHGHVTR